MKKYLLLAIVFFFSSLFVHPANAHFLFVYGEDGKVKVVFGEGTDPDQAQFLGGLKSMKAFTFSGDQKKQVKFEIIEQDGDGWFETSLDQVGSIVNITCPYGVFGRGDKNKYLDYSAKYVRFPIQSIAGTKPSKDLMLDMVPSFENGMMKVTVHFMGMPLNNAEVSLTRMEFDRVDTKSNDAGVATLDARTRYIVRAKHVVEEGGEVEGKSFDEKRYYCTMVLDLGNAASSKVESVATASQKEPTTKSSSRFKLEPVDHSYDDFPRGVTSFGATVHGGKIYAAGGKSGRAHHYARSYQNREVWSLDLAGQKWEAVGETLGLQGLAIVAHEGKIIRIGGLEARNEEGEEHALRSLATVKSFDPKTKQWTTLPSLPQGRSSLDACLHDNRIYVAGGWTMEVGEDSEWATDMLVLDLAAGELKWRSIETPFEVRAVAVRAFDNKIFVLGGIDGDGGPTDSVHVCDLQTEQWSSGPEIPSDGGMKAFGCSAVSVGGQLLVNTYDGGVYRLKDDQSGWEKLHQLVQGRFFHQMVPVDKSRFAIIGGANMSEGSQTEVVVMEIVELDE